MPDANRDFLSEPEVFRPADTAAASRAVRSGRLRRVARGFYTADLETPVEQLVSRNWIEVASIAFPGAVIVDRSAVEGRPAADGSLFVDSGPEPRNPSPVRLPGLVVKPRAGPGRLPGDMQFGPLARSGEGRTALDNVRASRARSGVARTLTRAELEEWLERIARNRGEAGLLQIRDEAAAIAADLDAEEERQRLDDLIGSLLGTGEARLVTAAGRARGRRAPFDATRVELFEQLHGALAGHIAVDRPEPPDPNRVFAFFEAYFSNFIEGTEFDVAEAEAIVFRGEVPDERPEDAHDVIGTFAAATEPGLRARVPADAEDLATLLQRLNRKVLEWRPALRPGEWKNRANRAGGTVFVAPELVVGTLRQAWRFYETLPAGFARGTFALFAVSEVHPFADGNGRVARLLLNAELSAAAQCRVVIPLSFRTDYLGALRALSRNGDTGPLLRAVDRAQRWAALVEWSSMERASAQLEAANALASPTGEAEAILRDPPNIGP